MQPGLGSRTRYRPGEYLLFRCSSQLGKLQSKIGKSRTLLNCDAPESNDDAIGVRVTAESQPLLKAVAGVRLFAGLTNRLFIIYHQLGPGWLHLGLRRPTKGVWK